MDNKEDLDAFRTALLWLIAAVIVWFLTSCATPPTGDLFTGAQSNRATADALLQQAQYQEQFLTATAQAPIINITSSAAAFVMQQSYGQATSTAAAQTQIAAVTITAQSWTPTPNATMTAVFAQSYADATRVANEIILNNLEVERTRSTNQLWAMAPYFVGFLVVILVVMFGIAYAKRLSFMPATVDERGKVIPIISVIDGSVTDVDRNPNYRGMLIENLFQQWLRKKLDLPQLLPEITAERQDLVTARSQMVDMVTRARLPKRLLEEQERLLLPASSQSIANDFVLPSWEIINNWDGKNGIPYYTANGLETIDIERFPHLSAIGMTGMGKSRHFFRPLIACALAAGHRVVIIGKLADYRPFEDHPNATLLKVSQLTEPDQAQRYAKILEAVVVEMNRRDDVLTAAHQSTWSHAGRNRTFIVLDEVGNAMRLMDSETSKQSRIWIEGLVSESRKVGFNIVIANQRATGMASILSQTGKAIFRVEADEERAHRSLAGASTLHDGYFLAKFGVPKIAGAFKPTDEQIKTFLASRQVDKVEDDDQWIEGIISDAPVRLPDQNQPTDDAPKEPSGGSLLEFVSSLDDQGARIVEMYQAGHSLNAIQKEVVGFMGGAAFNKVKDIVDRYKAVISTTTHEVSLQGATGQ